LHLEQLPGYAPDLNPDEGIWNYLKRVELGNVCCADLDHLHRELIRAKERLRHKKEIIGSCSRQCGYLASCAQEIQEAVSYQSFASMVYLRYETDPVSLVHDFFQKESMLTWNKMHRESASFVKSRKAL
jgi:hypothetical protein